ncbi:M23 family metallopeptidase [Leptolyngbya sp. FACHB-321]|uniref:LysM peptidoglycan-binding domain-containing M23 family metallopeptidase n=1 Tax=Leptolyngbya sp. FACHB-321 TaxID=2692807 RepID=UPI001687C53F|nr:M23 family metallopeptidase [Leptolyngbya sp. FACHB-321]MBD2037437.1 M23 family metallopeptidase [Leptolyngbya sp. FACHB-321]
MKCSRWLAIFFVCSGITLAGTADARLRLLAQTASPEVSSPTCAPPVLSRLVRHKVAAGETLDSIAQQYNLIPSTLMGFNPALRSGKAPLGAQILVPPYNGIRVELKPNQTWRDVAKTYNVRPDVLFELNGCQSAPRAVFVPGVNWSPVATAAAKPTSSPPGSILNNYPLATKPSRSALLLNYGWGIQPLTGKVGFHSGIDLAATVGSPVLAVADGTVAFAGSQSAYGTLVVINHAEALQTRYAQLATLKVKVGQVVKRGQTIATVGRTGTPSTTEPHLHFEVRSRSALGWVAENPEPYVLRAVSRLNHAQK